MKAPTHGVVPVYDAKTKKTREVDMSSYTQVHTGRVRSRDIVFDTTAQGQAFRFAGSRVTGSADLYKRDRPEYIIYRKRKPKPAKAK